MTIGAVETMGELSNNDASSIWTKSSPRSTDGCSYSPDQWGKANFKPACDRHDICYSKSSKVNRKTCDTEFGGRSYKGQGLNNSLEWL